MFFFLLSVFLSFCLSVCTHVPVPCVKEEIIEVMQHGLTETMKEKTGRQGNLSDEVEKPKSQLYDGESTFPADKEPVFQPGW